MIISRKRFQEELLKEREQAFNEAMRRQDEENRLRWVHERIDGLERRIYKLEEAMRKTELVEMEALNGCLHVGR